MPERLDPQLDARLLRQIVDGELAGGELHSAEAMLQGGEAEAVAARQLVQDERRLQEAVGRVMGSRAAPAIVKAQVLQLMASTPAETAVASSETSAGVGRVDRQPAATHNHNAGVLARLFASPQRANFAAVAAVLALIAGAVLFGIYGRTIDDAPPRQTVDVVGNAAQYVDDEHTECTTSLEHIQKEVRWLTPREAELGMTELLGAPVRAFDLTDLNYQFVGAGGSNMPLEQQPSGHLIYRKVVNGKPGPMASVFIAPARGCCSSICASLSPGEWQIAKSECKRRVVYSTDRRLVYFLVCCDERDQPAIGQAISQATASSR